MLFSSNEFRWHCQLFLMSGMFHKIFAKYGGIYSDYRIVHFEISAIFKNIRD